MMRRPFVGFTARRSGWLKALLACSICIALTFPVTSTAQVLLSWPESVVFDTLHNRYLVSNWNSGSIVAIDSAGVQSNFVVAQGCQAGLEIVGDSIYVGCSAQGVKGYNLHTGQLIMHVTIPGSLLLNDVTSDTSGNIYVTDVDANRIVKIRLNSHSYSIFVSSGVTKPNGILFDKQNNRLMLVSTRANSPIQAVRLSDSTVSTVAMSGLNDLDGLAMDKYGRWYVSSWGTRAVYRYAPDFSGYPVGLYQNSGGPADLNFNFAKDSLIFPLLYLNSVISLAQTGVTFKRVTAGSIWDDADCAHGVNWIDYNNDGLLDLYVPHWFYDGFHSNALYTNDGSGGFAKVLSDAIVTDQHSLSATWADYDNDGDVDGFACSPPTTSGVRPNYMYVNNGDGSFTKLTSGSVATDLGMSVSATWGDFDNDGDVDLLVGNHCPPPCTGGLGPFYYRNDGDSLARIDRQLIGLPNGDFAYHSVCDFDYDGDLDIVYRRNEQSNVVYRNDGDGTFTQDNTLPFAADNSIGFSWADYDNDGDFDLLETRSSDCRLYKNTGGTFNLVSLQAFNPGSGTWLSGAWGDCDNDGDLDVVTTSFDGYFQPRLNAFLVNNGDGTFFKAAAGPVATDLEPSLGAAWADYDRDGDLDLVINNENYYHTALYQNDGNNNAWLDVICGGSLSNRFGIGAKVRAVATIGGQVVRQLREITSQSSLFSQAPLEAHFGLGNATAIDSLIVEWPSGVKDEWVHVTPRQVLTVKEGSSDIDGDGIGMLIDNCPFVPNPLQEDANTDGIGDSCCCVGLTGNVDCDPEDGADISDLTALIDNLYISLAPLCCPAEANLDGSPDGNADISDLTALIDYLYISFTTPARCR